MTGDADREAVRPFDPPSFADELDDLRSRLSATRWAPAKTVPDGSQGIPQRRLRRLVEHWADGWDHERWHARIRAVPHVITTIDGVDVHAVHLRSPDPDATPLVLTHGWPGSFLEFLDVAPALADPASHGSPGDEAFHVVLPSLPGYGFSAAPSEAGWGVERIASAWVELMDRLGHGRFLAAGSDWGTSVSTMIGRDHPDKLVGLHLVPPLAPPDRSTTPDPQERRALDELAERTRTGSAYAEVHGTRPQTVGAALDDSPAGLCAWIAEKLDAWTQDPLDDDTVLDLVAIYWFTRSATTSARLYWESDEDVDRWILGEIEDVVEVPTGAAVYPAEVPRTSRRWAARTFTDLVRWSEPARGGHFAALEEPASFVEELRATRAAIRERSTCAG